MFDRLVEIMSLSERRVQRWFDVEQKLHCANSVEKAFVEYPHWQEPHLENVTEQPKHFVLNAFTLEE